jgi:hypothetical protein
VEEGGKSGRVAEWLSRAKRGGWMHCEGEGLVGWVLSLDGMIGSCGFS